MKQTSASIDLRLAMFSVKFLESKLVTDRISFLYVPSECGDKISIASTSGGNKDIY